MSNSFDDYYNNGLFEIARKGKNTIIHSNMSVEKHKKIIKRISQQYKPRKRAIDRLIKIIRKKIMKCNPFQLLAFLFRHFSDE